MPVAVAAATVTAEPEPVHAVRNIPLGTISPVHAQPRCRPHTPHRTGGAFVVAELWADIAALKTHLTVLRPTAADHPAPNRLPG